MSENSAPLQPDAAGLFFSVPLSYPSVINISLVGCFSSMLVASDKLSYFLVCSDKFSYFLVCSDKFSYFLFVCF